MTETAAQPHQRSVKFKALESSPGPDGDPNHTLVAYPTRQDGEWSQYPSLKMFLRGGDVEEMVGYLEGLAQGDVITLQLIPGKIKKNKLDNGDFANYYWNVDGIGGAAPLGLRPEPLLDGSPPGEEGPPPESQGVLPESQDTPPIQDGAPPTTQGVPETAQGRTQEAPGAPPLTGRDADPIQMSIDIAWSINNAREFVQFMHGRPESERVAANLWEEIKKTANAFLSMKRNIVTEQQARTQRR